MSTTSEKLSYLNETKGKIKRAINNFGGKLTNDSTFRSYPDELYNAWDNIFNQLPHVEDTSTSPSLSSTLEAPMRNNLKGNTSQTQYSGKNLLPPTIATETKNGITLTNNGDGSYTLTGTYSTSTTFDMALPATLNGTYSFSGNNPTAGKNIQFRILKSSGSPWSTYLSSVNRTSTNQTIENGITQEVRIVGSFTSGFTFKPQLESGSTATSYEPYVGGVATPNPTNPADVNVVSGDNEISITGKNLFDKTRLISGKRLDNTGLPSIPDNTYCTTDYFIKVEPNTTYYSTSTINQSKAVCFYDSGQTFIERKMYLNAHTFTTGTTTQFIKISILLSEIDTEQLEKGSTATTYEPYQGNTYNIDLPVENLVDTLSSNSAIVGSGLTYTRNADGSVRINGTTNRAYDYVITTNYSFIAGETYTFSWEMEETSNINPVLYMQFNANNGNTLNLTKSTKTITRTITEAQTLAFKWSQGANKVVDFTFKVQVEKGSKASPYTPYGSAIELCKIGNYQDYFYKDSDKWYKHGAIGKVVFTGGNDETWNISETSIQGSNRFLNESIKNYVLKPSANSQAISMFSNYFMPKSANQTYSNQEGIDVNPSGNFHVFADSTKTYTVAQFKTWLSTHNLSVYYPLATPTNTEITDTTLINQLEELYIAKSKENQTNISQINNDLPFIISATALLDANTYIMQLEAELEASS